MKSQYSVLIGFVFLLILVSQTGFARGTFNLQDVSNIIASEISSESMMTDLDFLAGNESQGRETGTEDEIRAGNYIASQFSNIGLNPAGTSGSDYFQDFFVPNWMRVVSPIQFKAAETNKTFEFGIDYIPFEYTGEINGTNELVFVGYGISQLSVNYDDYAQVDVKGKVVIVFRDAPEGWKGSLYNRYFGYKAVNARAHGAVGMILVLPPNKYKNRSPLFGTLMARNFHKDFGAIWAHSDVIDKNFLPNSSLLDLEQSIDSEYQSGGYDGKFSKTLNISAQMEINIEFEEFVPSRNVLGFLPSENGNSDEILIVSAHYDSMGVRPDGKIYYGAEDDASGIVTMIETARVLSELRSRNDLRSFQRSILFVAWSGTEMDLLGSEYFINNPTVKIDAIKGMFTLELVGAGSRDESLLIEGKDAAPDLVSEIENAGKAMNVSTVSSPLYAKSDHISFLINGIPGVMVYWGTSAYPYHHTPDDTIDKIDPQNLVDTTKVVTMAAWNFSTFVEGAETTITTTSSQGQSTSDSNGTNFETLAFILGLVIVAIIRKKRFKSLLE